MEQKLRSTATAIATIRLINDLDLESPFFYKQTASNTTTLISGGNLPAGSVLAITPGTDTVNNDGSFVNVDTYDENGDDDLDVEDMNESTVSHTNSSAFSLRHT